MGGRDQRGDDHEGNHAHQQDLEGVIVIVHDVFHRRNVEHHLHFDSAQRAEFSKVRRTVKCQEVKPQTLHEGDKERFHQLAVTDIAKAPYQERNFSKDIAFCKASPKVWKKFFSPGMACVAVFATAKSPFVHTIFINHTDKTARLHRSFSITSGLSYQIISLLL